MSGRWRVCRRSLAVPSRVPPSLSSGLIVLAMASGRRSIETLRSSVSSIRPDAVRRPPPTSRARLSRRFWPAYLEAGGCDQARGQTALRQLEVSEADTEAALDRGYSAPLTVAVVPFSSGAWRRNRWFSPLLTAVAWSDATSMPPADEIASPDSEPLTTGTLKRSAIVGLQVGSAEPDGIDSSRSTVAAHVGILPACHLPSSVDRPPPARRSPDQKQVPRPSKYRPSRVAADRRAGRRWLWVTSPVIRVPPAVKFEIAQPTVVFGDGDAEASLTRTRSSNALPVTWPLRSPFCSVPSKPSAALRRFLPTSVPLGNVGAEGEADQPVGARCTPLGGQPAGGLIGQQRQIGERQVEVEIGGPVAKVPSAVRSSLVVEDAQFVGDQARSRRAPTRPVMRVSPASRLSAASLPILSPVATLSSVRSKAPLTGSTCAVRLQCQGAGQFAPRQLREWRDAGRLHRDVAA